jgi:hypothetical protein
VIKTAFELTNAKSFHTLNKSLALLPCLLHGKQ